MIVNETTTFEGFVINDEEEKITVIPHLLIFFYRTPTLYLCTYVCKGLITFLMLLQGGWGIIILIIFLYSIIV